jgi:hypothetical protein
MSKVREVKNIKVLDDPVFVEEISEGVKLFDENVEWKDNGKR